MTYYAFWGSWRRNAFVLIVLLIGAVGAFFIFRGFQFSLDDVTFSIEAPGEVDAGVAFPLRVTLENHSRVSLEHIAISLEIPKDVVVLEADVARSIGNNLEIAAALLGPKEKKTFSFQFASEAQPDTASSFRAKLEFRPQGLIARFSKEKTHAIRVARVPVGVALEFPEKVQAGEMVTVSAKIVSESDRTLRNLRLRLTYPSQFEFFEALPDPCVGTKDCWDMSELLPGQQTEVLIRGQFPDGNLEVTFRAELGLFNVAAGQLRVYTETSKAVRVEPPLFSITQWFNGVKNPRNLPLEPGALITMRIAYENRSSIALENVALRLKIDGRAPDLAAFIASEDFVREGVGEFRWDPADVFALRFLRPGAGGEFSFSLRVRDVIPFASLSEVNPMIRFRMRAQSAKGLLAEQTSTFQINTKLTMHQEVLFTGAPGGRNSGPLPPKVGQETTYTVVWQVVGGVNGVRGVVARGVLGPSVKFFAVLTPEAAPFTYDANTKEVIWAIGDVVAGTGIFTPPKEVVFRIVLTPQPIEAGTKPELVSFAKVTGEDVFTAAFREYTLAAPVRTDLPDDRSVEEKQAVVQP